MAEMAVGLSRVALEREVRWLLRRAPSDPAKLITFFGEVLVDVVEANNAAIAAHLAGSDDPLDEPEGY